MNEPLKYLAPLLALALGAASVAAASSAKAESSDPLIEALLLIEDNYVTKPQAPEYRGMVGQGLLRIANAVGRSKLRLVDSPETWTLQCVNRPLQKTFSKNTFTTVEAVYAALHEGLTHARVCMDNAQVPADLVYITIKGVVSTLDSQSYLIEPSRYDDIKAESNEGVVGEIGLELEARDGDLLVSDLKLGMPADSAGVKVGDRLVRIDERATGGLTTGEAEALLRGSIGSTVVLAVERSGSDRFLTFTLTREISRFQSVKFKLLSDSIAYVRIALFHGPTLPDLRTVLERLQARNTKAMVLDLRDNSGGLLNSAIGVSEYFIKRDGLITVVKGRGDRRDEHRSKATQPPLSYPLVVLINHGTASSAEIVAAALQDWGRAVLVGTKSHGKGSVQAIYPLPGDYAIRLTTAYYVTPLGRQLQSDGINPDLVVEAKDQQLNAAIDLLLKHVPTASGARPLSRSP